jgi:hypothetical protein
MVKLVSGPCAGPHGAVGGGAVVIVVDVGAEVVVDDDVDDVVDDALDVVVVRCDVVVLPACPPPWEQAVARSATARVTTGVARRITTHVRMSGPRAGGAVRRSNRRHYDHRTVSREVPWPSSPTPTS